MMKYQELSDDDLELVSGGADPLTKEEVLSRLALTNQLMSPLTNLIVFFSTMPTGLFNFDPAPIMPNLFTCRSLAGSCAINPNDLQTFRICYGIAKDYCASLSEPVIREAFQGIDEILAEL